MDRTTEKPPDEASVTTGSADKTPLVAIGATATVIGVVFVVALGLAVLAYLLAS